jgi:DMSO/TMAO reductase YedYZ heme-binding membrane subunit
VIHYILSKKGDIFHLSGDIGRPLVYGIIVLILLVLRLPFIRRFFSSFRSRIVSLFVRRSPQPKFDTE